MAKGQKRGNRELKKPKITKTTAPATAASSVTSRGIHSLVTPKNKP